jgi:hypothetical protein
MRKPVLSSESQKPFLSLMFTQGMLIARKMLEVSLIDKEGLHL